MSPLQKELMDAVCELAKEDSEVIGILLQGSLARGDGYPGSDLDLFFLLREGSQRPFSAEEQSRILVEKHYADFARATAKIRSNPMLAYGFRDGLVLRDDTGQLAQLAQIAKEVITAYRMPPEERAGIFHWLRSASVKMAVALEAGDILKASFVAATTSWKILEGMWAMNALPMPPSGTVIARRGDLLRAPDGWEALFTQLFLAGDATERVGAAQELIAWILMQE